MLYCKNILSQNLKKLLFLLKQLNQFCRYRKQSTEKPVGDFPRHSYHAADESFEVDKSSATVQHPTLNNNSEVAESRSFSAPVKATRMFRFVFNFVKLFLSILYGDE